MGRTRVLLGAQGLAVNPDRLVRNVRRREEVEVASSAQGLAAKYDVRSDTLTRHGMRAVCQPEFRGSF